MNLYFPVKYLHVLAAIVILGTGSDLMQPQPATLDSVIAQFRRSLGTSEMPRVTLPGFLLGLGSRPGDLVSRLGWMPAMRSTAIVLMLLALLTLDNR